MEAGDIGGGQDTKVGAGVCQWGPVHVNGGQSPLVRARTRQ